MSLQVQFREFDASELVRAEDRFVITREELLDKMAVLLGGRAAEWATFHHLSTGAADDLAKVTDIARDMVTRFGMEPSLGPVFLRERPVAVPDRPAGVRGPPREALQR
jgi:cell division protease FtsH